MNRRELITLGALAAALPAQTTPAYSLPKLPYAADALEPFIDARTMEIHHGKHHQAYVDNLNKALAGRPAQPLDQLLKGLSSLPDSIRNAVRNNGGGHANHSLFWQTLGKGSPAPKGKLATAIGKSFGDQAKFEAKLHATGLTVFGSGWVWVTLDKGALAIETSPNQDSPWLVGKNPLLGIDVWEHAYYLKYQNRRAEYLTAVMKVLNWDFIGERYTELSK